jgi:hypothetical protein
MPKVTSKISRTEINPDYIRMYYEHQECLTPELSCHSPEGRLAPAGSRPEGGTPLRDGVSDHRERHLPPGAHRPGVRRQDVPGRIPATSSHTARGRWRPFAMLRVTCH